jgi:hypothetical protein
MYIRASSILENDRINKLRESGDIDWCANDGWNAKLLDELAAAYPFLSLSHEHGMWEIEASGISMKQNFALAHEDRRMLVANSWIRWKMSL